MTDATILVTVRVEAHVGGEPPLTLLEGEARGVQGWDAVVERARSFTEMDAESIEQMRERVLALREEYGVSVFDQDTEAAWLREAGEAAGVAKSVLMHRQRTIERVGADAVDGCWRLFLGPGSVFEIARPVEVLGHQTVVLHADAESILIPAPYNGEYHPCEVVGHPVIARQMERYAPAMKKQSEVARMTEYEMLLEAERRQLQSIREAFALTPDMDMALLGWHETMRKLGGCCAQENGGSCCIDRLLNKGYARVEPLEV